MEVNDRITNEDKKQIEPVMLWLSLIGHVYLHLINEGFLRSYGLLYLEFLDMFNEGPSLTSLIATIFAIFVTCNSIVAGILNDRFGAWKVMCLAGILTPIGFIVCTFSPTIYVTYVGYGAFAGLGINSGFMASVTAVSRSFCYNRTVALGIAFAGGSVGIMIYPLLFEATVSAYTARGYLLINAGLFLNNLVLAGLIWTTTHIKTFETKEKYGINSKAELQKGSEESQLSDTHSKFTEKETKTISEHKTESIPDKGKKNIIWKLLSLKILSVVLWYFTYTFALFGYIMYFPPYARDLGMTDTQIGVSITVYGVADLISRIGIGILGRKVNNYLIVTIHMTVVGVITIVLPSVLAAVTMYYVFIVHMLCLGLLAGGIRGLMGSFAVKAAGTELAGTAIGMASVGFGIGLALPPVIYGALKETTRSYAMVPYLSGAACIISAVVIQIGKIKSHFRRICRFNQKLDIHIHTDNK